MLPQQPNSYLGGNLVSFLSPGRSYMFFLSLSTIGDISFQIQYLAARMLSLYKYLILDLSININAINKTFLGLCYGLGDISKQLLSVLLVFNSQIAQII